MSKGYGRCVREHVELLERLDVYLGPQCIHRDRRPGFVFGLARRRGCLGEDVGRLGAELVRSLTCQVLDHLPGVLVAGPECPHDGPDAIRSRLLGRFPHLGPHLIAERLPRLGGEKAALVPLPLELNVDVILFLTYVDVPQVGLDSSRNHPRAG